MSSQHERVEELFWQASQLPSETERISFLDAACGSDHQLRDEVQQLLSSRTAADLMAAAYQPTLALAQLDMTGKTIGPYKLREKIGEGGMGVVYAADQKAPVKRRVALKVIKPGMNSQQVIARFESERQTLALMDHPSIARVLDAGTTDQGLPYFVMELVNGSPITRYCDENRLTIRQRLELMVPICRAVQHAHQKGIIHRDLKPSNILIAQYDGKPVPKVIDFGVAKAVGSQLGDYSVYTDFGMLIGTLEYMSPEQAQRNQLDIDTRSDVYSLGVVLYELLAGVTPFDSKRLRSAAFDEMLCIIRDEAAPRPSLKLSTSRMLQDVASSRSVSPERLSKVVRGELDWIVMKALEKDRNRRYESSLMLGQDIERFLNSEAVLASPPSFSYSSKKFLYRHWRSFAVSAVLAIAIGLGAASLGWATWQRAEAYRASTERLERLWNSIQASEEMRDWAGGVALIDRELGQNEDASGLADAPIQLLQHKKLLQLFLALDEAHMLSSERNQDSSYLMVDSAYRRAFETFELNPEEDSIELTANRLRSLAQNRAPIIEALADWANFKKRRMDSVPEQLPENWRSSLQKDAKSEAPSRDEILRQCQRLLAIADALDADPLRTELRRLVLAETDERRWLGLINSPELEQQSIGTKLLLARIANRAGYQVAATEIVRRLQYESPGDFWCNYELAELLCGDVDSQEKALQYYASAVALRPENTGALSGLAVCLFESGEFQEAERWLKKVLSIDDSMSHARSVLGDVYRASGNTNAALAVYHHLLASDPKNPGTWYRVGLSEVGEKNINAAIAAFEKALAITPRFPAASEKLIELYTDKKEYEKAEATFRQAISAWPEFAYFYNSLGSWLLEQKRPEDAILTFRQGKEAAHFDVQSLCNLNINLGMTLRYWAPKNEAREIEAIECFRKCVELNPEWGPGHDQLSRALATSRFEQLRDPLQAVLHGQRAVDLAIASNGSAGGYELATLGMAKYRAGNWEACLTALDSPNVHPELAHAPTDLYMAMATWQTGDREKARHILSKSIERLSEKNKPSDLEREALAEAKELMLANPAPAEDLKTEQLDRTEPSAN